MPRINPKKIFFKENYFYFFGGFWILMGFILWLLVKNAFYFTYFPLGLGIIVYGYMNKTNHSAFIEWNDTSITLKEWTGRSLIFKFQEINQIVISKGHLTIKSGAANGVMVELKDYREEDILFLQKSLPSFPLAY